MGRLTTHVLDVAHGRPAAGVRIELWRLDEPPVFVKAVSTNEDGRVDAPLLSGDAMQAGRYELRFFVGNYYRSKEVTLPEPAFFDVVPVEFGIFDAQAHYHVPLLISPYGYSTYRGS